MPVNPILSQEDQIIAIEQLALFETKLQDILAEEGFSSVEIFAQTFLELKQEYSVYVANNQTSLNPSKRLAKKIDDYEHIQLKIEEIVHLKTAIQAFEENNRSSKVPAQIPEILELHKLYEEKVGVLNVLLSEEGGISEDDFLKLYNEKATQLVDFEAQGKGSAKPANRLRTELSELEPIKSIHNEIIQLREQLQLASQATDAGPADVKQGDSVLQQSIEIDNTISGQARVIDIDFDFINKRNNTGEKLETFLTLPAPILASAEANELNIQVNQLQLEFTRVIQTMPEFSEKTMAVLVLFFQYDELILKSTLPLPPLFDRTKLLDLIEKISSQLHEEGIKDKKIALQINQLRLLLSKYDPSNESILDHLILALNLLVEHIQSVDIAQMLTLIKNMKVAAARLAGQEIIALFGLTGVGKSTAANFLMGCSFESLIVEGELDRLIATPRNSDQTLFVTSSAARSETSVISAAKVALTDIEPSWVGNVAICDTPGFSDTRGAAIDIVNGICLVEAISKAAKVKPVIVISQQSIGDRCQGLRKLVTTLVQLMPDIENELPTFSYVFTKYDPAGTRQINPTFRSLLKTTKQDRESASPALIALLDDMAKKTAESPLTLNPLSDKAATIYQVLLNSPRIENPDECFQPFASSESLDKLRDQLNKIVAVFKRGLRTGQSELIIYKFTQVAELRDELKLAHVTQCYEEMAEESRTIFSYIKMQISDRFRRISLDGNTEIEEDINGLIVEINYLCALEGLRALIPDEHTHLVEWCQLGLMRFTKMIKNNLIGQSDTIMALRQHTNLLDPSVSLLPPNGVPNWKKILMIESSLKNIHSLGERFVDELRRDCIEVTQYFQGMFDDYLDSSLLALEQCQLKAFILYASESKKLLESYHNCFSDEHHAKYAKTMMHFQKSLYDANDFIKGQFQNAVEQDVQRILHQYTMLTAVIELPEMGIFCDVDAVRTGIGQINAIMEQYFDILDRETVVLKLTDFNLDVCAYLNKLVNQMSQLVDSERIGRIVMPHYTSIVKKIENFIHNQYITVSVHLDNIARNPEGYNAKLPYKEIAKSCEILLVSSELSSLQGHLYRNHVEELKGLLSVFYDKILPRIVPLSFDPDFINKLPVYLTILHKIYLLLPIEAILFGELHSGKTILTNFESQLAEILLSIQKYAHSPNMLDNYEQLILSLQLLHPFLIELSGPVLDDIVSTINILYENFSKQYIAFSDLINQNASQMLVMKTENRRVLLSYIDDVMKHLIVSYNLTSESKYLLSSGTWLSEEYAQIQDKVFNALPNQFIDHWISSPDGVLVRVKNTLQTAIDKISEGNPDHEGLLKVQLAEKLKSIAVQFPKVSTEFSTLAIHLEHAINNQMTGLINELKVCASKKDYHAFKELYTRIKATQPEMMEAVSSILLELRNDIASQVQELSERVSKIKLSPKTQSALLAILKDSDTLGKASVLLVLGSDDTLESLKRTLDNINVTLNRLLEDFFCTTENVIQSGSYLDAAHRVKFVEGMLPAISSGSMRVEELNNRCVTLLNLIRSAAAEKNSKYNSQAIDDYTKSLPGDYLKQLDQLVPIDGYYSDLSTQLREIIRSTIVRTIEECKQDEPQFDVYSRLSTIKGLNPYIPLDIYSEVKSLADEMESFIRNRHEGEQRLLEELSRAKDMTGLVYQLVNSFNEDRMKILSNQILNIMRESEQVFKIAISNSNLKDVIIPFAMAWKDWQYYGQQIKSRLVVIQKNKFYRNTYGFILDPQIPEQICSDMLARVNIEFTKMCESIEQLNSLYLTAKPLALRIICSHIELLSELFKLSENYSTNKYLFTPPAKHLLDSLHSINNEWSNAKLIHLLDLCVTTFCHHQKKFDDALKANEFAELAEIMVLSEEFNTTLEHVQSVCKYPIYRSKHPEKVREIESCLSYSVMRIRLAEELVRLNEVASEKMLEHKRARSTNSLDRSEFYRNISSAYAAFKSVRFLTKHVDPSIADVNLLETKAYEKICANLDEICIHILTDIIRRLPTTDKSRIADLNIWYDNLVTAQNEFKDTNLSNQPSILTRRVSTELIDKLEQLQSTILEGINYDTIIDQLLYFKLISVHAPLFKRLTDDMIERILNHIKKLNNGPKQIALLAEKLKARDDEFGPEARMMLDDHMAFKSFAIALRNLKTAQYDIHYILDKLLKNPDNIDSNLSVLLSSYEMFDKQYWEIVEPGMLQIKAAIQEIIGNVKRLAKSVNMSDLIPCPDLVIELSANLFAYWTLAYAAVSEVDDEQDNFRDTLLKPHAAQVVSIFRLLNIDSPDHNPSSLPNHLVEIGTGEGKSVTMAITASILALVGFDVDCACYSEYLSNRDHMDFNQFFKDFGVAKYIQYGTFNKLSERKINSRSDLRSTIINMIQTNAMPSVIVPSTSRKKIIFIDEADVFFTPDFYGNNYRPLVELRDETINEIIKYIWSIRNNKPALRWPAVKASAQFIACVARFSNWAVLIEESVKAMIVDVQTYDTIACVVVDDKIGYPEQHGVSTDVSYGYKTLFAYFDKQENGEITLSSRDARIAIILDVGSFSYAEVPNEYEAIIGVTGTLKTLSPPQKVILEREYQIKKFTYMPSVYGDGNKLNFAGDSPRDVIITPTVGWYNAIVNEITLRRGSSSELIQRPVMVFFESILELTKFYRSAELQRSGLLDKILIISEEIRDDLKQGLIRQATSSATVTLLTRGFGRGTDFRCFDDRINALGGVHVTVTFVSDALTEEAQLMGRTSRQGDQGSFSMVITSESLDRYRIGDPEIARMRATKELYTTLDRARNKFFTEKYTEEIRHVKSISEDHQKSLQFLDNLYAGRLEPVRNFLQERNHVVSTMNSDNVSRSIVLMDATGSMSALLEKAKNTVQDTYRRVSLILREKGYAESAFELKFVVYRNYSSQNQILVASGWESNAENLQRFMTTVRSSGGQGREAIEIGLAYVNTELTKGPISQVILIGDVAPNTREEVAARRAGSGGEAYWRTTAFTNPTYYVDEINAMQRVANPPPIHAFYVQPDAKDAFAEIARTTNASTGLLDIETERGAEMLTGIVSERVLHSIGGDSLVMAYREKFGSQKGYVASPASFFKPQDSAARATVSPSHPKAVAGSAADAELSL